MPDQDVVGVRNMRHHRKYLNCILMGVSPAGNPTKRESLLERALGAIRELSERYTRTDSVVKQLFLEEGI
jgi:hypothetical protein